MNFIHRHSYPYTLVAILSSLTSAASFAQTTEPTKDAPTEARPAPEAKPWSVVLGAAVVTAPIYAGDRDYRTQLHPLWAAQYGRLRFSPGRTASMMGDEEDRAVDRGTGASVDMLKRKNITAGLALRIDTGRRAKDAAILAGLPDIRATLRGRAYLGYKLTNHWSATLGASYDLLGRDGGGLFNLSSNYSDHFTPTLSWTVGVGVNFADATYMNTHFGISPDSAARTGRTAYAASAGVRDVGAGASLNWRIAPRWYGFAGVGLSQLQGEAANSPLTQRTTSWNASVGAAYRFGSR